MRINSTVMPTKNSLFFNLLSKNLFGATSKSNKI